MTGTKAWIEFSQSINRIAERQSILANLYHNDAVDLAWQLLERRLCTGVAYARASIGFSLIHEAAGVTTNIPLTNEGDIPQCFWWHYRDARQKAYGFGRFLVDESISEVVAKLSNNGASFHNYGGLPENSTMTGHATGIFVRRHTISDLMPGKQGELKTARFEAEDEPLISIALRIINRYPRSSARRLADRLAHYANGQSHDAKRERLRKEIGVARKLHPGGQKHQN